MILEEPLWSARPLLFEVDDVAEPKALLSCDLREPVLRYGSLSKTAAKIGVSEAFIRQNANLDK